MAEYVLKKDLTINNITEIQEGIAKHIAQFNHLSLTIEKDLDVDFSGVQLLHSLKTYMEKINRSVTIQYEGNDKEMNPFLLSEFEEIITLKK